MIDNLIKLGYMIIKNLKIVFRSWSSLFLLIIGPLLLILIVGFVFGGNSIHDINIGVVAKEGINTEDVVSVLISDEIFTTNYQLIETCMLDLKLDNVQVCIEFSDDFEMIKNKASKGRIVFYYDNTKYNLVSYLTDHLQESLDLTSEQITLEIANNILGNIEDTVIEMESMRTKLGQFILNAKSVRDDLVNTKETLEDIQTKFKPIYNETLRLKVLLDENSGNINSTINLLGTSSSSVTSQISSVLLSIDEIENSIITYNDSAATTPFRNTINYTSGELVKELEILKQNLTSLNQAIIDYNSLVQKANKDLYDKTDNLIKLLEEMDLFIDQSIEQTQKNIILMSNAITEMEKIKEELDINIEKFSGIDKSQAETLINPIKSTFKPLFEDMPKINLVFPIVLVFILMFISILLSNIVVLREINSQSYFRNFLVPVRKRFFVISLYITNMMVIMFQIVIFLFVAKFKFNINLFNVAVPLLSTIFIVATIFTLLGMSVAYFMKNQQTSILLSTFITLAIFFFSDIIFPVEAMPKLAAFFAKLNPLVLGETIFRKIIYHGLPLSMQLKELIILGVFIIIFIFILQMAVKYNVKKS